MDQTVQINFDRSNKKHELCNDACNLFVYYERVMVLLRSVKKWDQDTKDYWTNKIISWIFQNYGREINLEDLRSNYPDYNDLCELLRPIHLKKDHWEISTSAYPEIKIQCHSVNNRPAHLRGSEIDHLCVCLQYAPFVHLNPGNQLTTFSDEIIRSGNFDIEVFGSAFNTRLPRYGCLFPKIEAPFGAIGTAEEIFAGILDGTIIAVGLLISPPSSKDLHEMAAGWVKKILDAKIKVNIIFAMSSTKEDLAEELLMFKPEKVIIERGYDFSTKKNVYFIHIGSSTVFGVNNTIHFFFRSLRIFRQPKHLA